jgi:hypothetical protein
MIDTNNNQSAVTARVLTIVGLLVIGLIHLLDSVETFHETRWLFWAYVALMAGTIVVSAALLHRPGARWLQAATLLAVGPIVGYVLSRTTGLPGADDDIGAWTDPLGLASLWVEGGVFLTSCYALLSVAATQVVPAERTRFRVRPLEG